MIGSWSKRICDWSRGTFGQASARAAWLRFCDERAELGDAKLRDEPEAIGDEAADAVITLATYVKARTGRELSEWVELKMQINEGRDWQCFGDGTGKRIKSPEQDAREKQLRHDWWHGGQPFPVCGQCGAETPVDARHSSIRAHAPTCPVVLRDPNPWRDGLPNGGD